MRVQKRNKKDFLVLAIFNCSRHGSRGVAAILRQSRTLKEPSRRFLRFFRLATRLAITRLSSKTIGCFAPQMICATQEFTNLVSPSGLSPIGYLQRFPREGVGHNRYCHLQNTLKKMASGAHAFSHGRAAFCRYATRRLSHSGF